MFGYVIANKPELKIREFDVYQGYYCGICKSLKRQYGHIDRLTLNYDITFVSLLLSSLSFDDSNMKECRCILHPLSKHKEISDQYVDFGADMSIVLSYFKCKDDYEDEHKKSAGCFKVVLKGAYKKVKDKYPSLVDKIEECLNESSKLEKNNTDSIDEIANQSGKMMAEIISYENNEWKETLYQLGFYLGKFIYIMDAYEDIEKDIKHNSFNILKVKKVEDNFEEWIEGILSMLITRACEEFERLPIIDNYDLLKNILYSGIWTRYHIVHKKRGDK